MSHMWAHPRRAARTHRCECGHLIRIGERYLRHVLTPNHPEVGNVGWWRLAECSECAERCGRGALLVTGQAALSASSVPAPSREETTP